MWKSLISFKNIFSENEFLDYIIYKKIIAYLNKITHTHMLNIKDQYLQVSERIRVNNIINRLIILSIHSNLKIEIYTNKIMLKNCRVILFLQPTFRKLKKKGCRMKRRRIQDSALMFREEVWHFGENYARDKAKESGRWMKVIPWGFEEPSRSG